jgi:DNA-binding beta-propeller fold protein YncE
MVQSMGKYKDNFISVINTETYKTTNHRYGEEPLRLKFSIDGNIVLVSNSGRNHFCL